MSLLNKVPRVLECPSAQVLKCLSSVQVPKFPSTLSARVPELPSALSTWVPKCHSSTRVPLVPKSLECSSVKVPFECLEYQSALRVPQVLESPSTLNVLSASDVWMPECLDCLESRSASVSQLVSQAVGQVV